MRFTIVSKFSLKTHVNKNLSAQRRTSGQTDQVVLGLGHVGVVGAQLGLVDLQGPLVVVLHLLVLALVLAQQRQVVELLGHVRVLLPQHLHRDTGGRQRYG